MLPKKIIKNIFKIYLLLMNIILFPAYLENILPHEFSKEQRLSVELKSKEYELRIILNKQKEITGKDDKKYTINLTQIDKQEVTTIEERLIYDYASKNYQELNKQFELWSEQKLGDLKDAKLYLGQKNEEYSMILELLKPTEKLLKQYDGDIKAEDFHINEALGNPYADEKDIANAEKAKIEKERLLKEVKLHESTYNKNTQLLTDLINNNKQRMESENDIIFIFNTTSLFENRSLIYENFKKYILPLTDHITKEEASDLIYYQMIIA